MNKLFTKNNFQYIALQMDDFSEFLILPNENLTEYTDRVVSKIDSCKTENEVLKVLIDEMN